jgi:hypothetical protein
MPDPANIAIRASTQAHLEIEDIKDGLVILKDGSCCLVLATTAINFGLLSEKEQEATIYAYAGLLNSLNFTVQLVIRSARKDVSSYLNLLEDRLNHESRKLIRDQIIKYRKFIQETVQKNNVLDKKFYLVIPMTSLEMGVARSLKKTALRQKNLPFDKNYIIQQGKINLYPKRDHLLRQLSRLGLKANQLQNQELIRLFFDIYNPESGGQQMAESSQYKTPIVKAAVSLKPEVKPSQEESTIHNQINNLVSREAGSNVAGKNGTTVS